MHNAGFKIIDRYEPIVLEIIDESVRIGAPLEIGLYKEEQCIRDYARRHTHSPNVNVHFNHRKYALIDIERTADLFEADILASKTMGATYGIQHVSSGPMTAQTGYAPRMYESLLDYIEAAEKLCAKHDFSIHLENTYESIEFYRTLYRKIYERQYQHIHFCFDIGHAKVWSGQTFDAWMELLEELQAMAFRLHFHLHANQGLGDEHLSFIEMETMGFDGNDGVFSHQPYDEMLRIINAKFNGSRKIFEVKPEFAFQNIEWARRATAR